MILLLSAIASVSGTKSEAVRPCIPAPANGSQPTVSAISDHRALRKIIGEPMPEAATAVMLYGKGGHLGTNEYSIILDRAANGSWQGTAVGRSQVWIVGAPFTPMDRKEWHLSPEDGQRLDDAISHRCPRKSAERKFKPSGPPPLDFIPERIDVVSPNNNTVTFYATEGGGQIATMIRPPRKTAVGISPR